MIIHIQQVFWQRNGYLLRGKGGGGYFYTVSCLFFLQDTTYLKSVYKQPSTRQPQISETFRTTRKELNNLNKWHIESLPGFTYVPKQ